jgi:hypothetical protein
MYIGYEIFYVKPGEALEKACGVCGTNCDRNEKVYGAASFAAAVGKKYDFHDVFVCPHAGQEWHEQALRLVLAIGETPSKRVADLMKLDLADLLAENGL